MRLSIFTICLLSFLPLFGQETSSVPMNSKLMEGLKKGARFEVTRTKERYQVQASAKNLMTKALSLVEIEVLSVAEDGSCQLLWTLKKNKIEAQGNDVFRMVLDKLENMTRDKSFIFELDSKGQITRLVNKAEVIKTYQALLEDLGAFMTEKEVDPTLAKSVLAGIEPFTKDDTVEDISLRDAKILFFRPEPMPTAEQGVKRTHTIENPFGGDPVPSTIWTRIEHPQPTMAWLVHEESLDYVAASPLMRAAIETQALMRGEQLPADFKLPKIEAVDRFAINGFNSLPPSQVIHEYIVLRDGQGRHDRDGFAVKPLPEREATNSNSEHK